MFERYVEFSRTHQPIIDMMEVHMVSESLGFAGTLDRVLTIKNKTMLVDIKTSNSIYPSYWLQLAAYNELLKEGGGKVDQVGILWLNAKTRTNGKGNVIQGYGWQLVTRSMSDVAKDWQLFKATYKLWSSINDEMKPRNISYQLKHKK